MIPVIDTGACIGCGKCEELCSSAFRVEKGKSRLISYDACEICDCNKVVESCPVNAISLLD